MVWAISGLSGIPRPPPGRSVSSPTATRCARSTSSASTTRSSKARFGRSRATSATRRPRELVEGARILVHAAAALDPRIACGDRVRQRRRHADAAVGRRRGRRAARRVRLVNGRLRRAGQAPDRGGRPAPRRRPLRRVEDRGRGRRPRLHAAWTGLRDPAPEDVHRARAARGLRDPLRLDPRRPPDLHAGRRLNRYQLLAVEDLVEAIMLSASKRTAAWQT